MQSRRYLSNNHPDNLSKWPTNLNKIENKKVNLPPVTYQAIDPKNIFVYGLYPPKFNKHGLRNNEANNTKANKTDYNNDLNKHGDTDREIKNDDNQSNDTQSEFRTTNFRTDVTNIRELRQHLLDHLLDYFLNIIMEEKNHNITRKKNSKDVMKVEKKLRNYYGPQTDVLVLDDEIDDYSDIGYDDNNYRRKNDDETQVVLTKNDYVDEKNITDKESIETQRNETEIDITENDQLLWQPTNKDQVYIDEISNKTIMIPIIEDYDDSSEIAAPVKRKDSENNDTIIEITEDSNTNLDNITTTTDKYDVLQEIKPNNVSENVTDDYIYANDDEESTEKLFFEDFPDSDDYSSIENDTSASATDKIENITVSTTDGQENIERPARRTLNDDSGQNSDEKNSKTRKSGAKMPPFRSRKHELNEKIVIVTSPDSSEEELAIKVNNKQFKTKKSRKLGKKQKKRTCRKSFVLNLNIKLI